MNNLPDNDINKIKDGPIKWFVLNPIAANLLMAVLVIGGLFYYTKITQEVFPEFALDTITISASYPGSTPIDTEQSIVLAIEDAVSEVEGIGEITSIANEGSAQVKIEILDTDQIIKISQDVKNAVDRINTFPIQIENLKTAIDSRRRDVISLALYGDVSDVTLRKVAEHIKDLLEQETDIGPVELSGAKEYEIHIEISMENLRKYNLNIPQIASIIKQTAIELGGGRLKTSRGEILVRMSEKRNYAYQFENIPIIIQENGAVITLKDIATVKEGFDDSDNFAFYNGKPAILFDVYRIGNQTPVSVVDAVNKHVDNLNKTLPDNLTITTYNDRSKLFKQRASLLIKNGIVGLILVVIFLALFLDIRLAFWVSLGIPISFAGAFLFFPFTDFTVNIISMFAFIIALGIVVDDAIVSGENIYHYRQKGYSPIPAAILGAREVFLPVTISILTNIIAFIPLLFIPGQMGKVFSVIPVVVILTFIVSLIESFFILPAHLTYEKRNKKKSKGIINKIIINQKKFNVKFEHFVENKYAPFLRNKIIKHRYISAAIFAAILIITIGYIKSGRLGMTLFPRIEADYAFAEAVLPVGSPYSKAAEIAEKLTKSAQEVIDQNGKEQISKGIFTSIRENNIQVRAFLTDPDIRPISTKEFTDQWRQKLGPVTGVENLSLLSNRGGPGSGAALTIELSHSNREYLDAAAIKLANVLAEFPNVKDIDDGSAQGKRQFDFTVKELGYSLGMNSINIAEQVRASFYGSEVFKQQREGQEVRILVRLPEEQRNSSYYIENLMIKTPTGENILLSDVVDIKESRAYTSINRRDKKRVIQVKSDVEPPSAAPAIIANLQKETLPNLVKEYPGLRYSFEGSQAEIRESMDSLFIGLISVLFVIYVLLALLFSSYIQPFMVLIAIPFGIIGASLGHFLMGYSLSIMSLFGILALSGVVVNDSLILIDFANRRIKAGMKTLDAIIEATMQRFRPIMLTTLTTFAGLAPMIFETSRQAKFLIPMALSLGFGILFATFLTLILVPVLYIIIDDVKTIRKKL